MREGNVSASGQPTLSDESGAALVMVLIATTLVTAVTIMMLATTDAESTGVASYRDGAEAFYAAEGALEVSIDELARMPSWTPALGGSLMASWSAPGTNVTSALGSHLDLSSTTAAIQAETNGFVGVGPNSPVWRLLGHAPVSSMWPDAGPVGDVYLAVWIADDVGETDGNPNSDSNDTIQLRAEGYGRRLSRRIVEAVIARAPTGVVRQISWREVR